MKIRDIFIATTLLLLLALPCSAQLASPVHIVPVIAKTGGAAGSDWMTSLSMSNVSNGVINVTAMFFRENTPNLPPFVPTRNLILTEGQTLTVEDVLGAWFPAQGNTKGALLLLADLRDGGPEDYARLTAATRIFNNADPDATYGQGVVSNLLGLMVAPGKLVLPGARFDDAIRSNVGVANLALSARTFLITTFAANGAEITSLRKTIPAFSMSQWSLGQLGVGSLSSPGRVEVVIDPDTVTWDPCEQGSGDIGEGSGAFLAYMSRIDQATSDADFGSGHSDWKAYIELCGEPTMPSVRAVTDILEQGPDSWTPMPG